MTYQNMFWRYQLLIIVCMHPNVYMPNCIYESYHDISIHLSLISKNSKLEYSFYQIYFFACLFYWNVDVESIKVQKNDYGRIFIYIKIQIW